MGGTWTVQRFVVVVFLWAALAAPGLAAPLFPDVPEQHWARDAVATLAARGLVEGYPDGTFKGDRAASRWEVALIVARLLARMEQEHATFATRAELDTLRGLVAALREELDALGVRVTNLEEATGRLDQRVTELERITFGGSLSTMVNAQTFVNRGSPAMVPAGGGPPTIDYNAVVGAASGAGGLLPNGLTLNPFVFGVLSVTDWAWGRPLTNGTGFTSVGELNLKVRVTDDLTAGMDLGAYTSQGDAVVDAFWGLPAPYLSNPFTAIAGTGAGPALAGVQPQNQQPFTRLNLDRLWLWFDPLETADPTWLQETAALLGLAWEPRVQLVLGAFRGTGPNVEGAPVMVQVKDPRGTKDADGKPVRFPVPMRRRFAGTGLDPAVYVPMVNPNNAGSRPTDLFHWQKRHYFLPEFGFQAAGHEELGEGQDLSLSWGTMGTRLANGTTEFLLGTGTGYFNHAEGATVALRQNGLSRLSALLLADRNQTWNGEIRFNFLHAANEASGGTALAVGLLQSAGPPIADWVNPAGFFVNQLGGPGDPRVAGVGTTSDVRPIATVTGLDGIAGVAGVPNFGGIGPQDQTSLGASFEYVFDPHERDELVPHEFSVIPWVRGRWAHTDYKPQKNSRYSTSGNLYEVAAGARFALDSASQILDLDARYVSVDPRYDPFVSFFPTPGGIAAPLWVSPNFSYFSDLYSLHDTQRYPQNRRGFEVSANWVFDQHPELPMKPPGVLYLRYGSLDQVQTSLQDVRFSAGSLGAGTPNSAVLGYSPGFMDAVFGPYSAATFFDPGTGNTLAGVLEDNRGRVRNLSTAGRYSWPLEFGDPNPAKMAPVVYQDLVEKKVQVPRRSVSVYGGFDYYNFFRSSSLSAILGPAGLAGENQNYVDLTFSGFLLGVDYDVTPDFEVYGQFTNVDIYGHLDPLNTYGAYAVASGNPRATVTDITQTYPEIGFNWKLAEDPLAGTEMNWGLSARYYTMTDHVPAAVFPSPSLPSLNLNLGPQAGAHPFNWNGYQLWSTFDVKF